jgi:hypothetical protein
VLWSRREEALEGGDVCGSEGDGNLPDRMVEMTDNSNCVCEVDMELLTQKNEGSEAPMVSIESCGRSFVCYSLQFTTGHLNAGEQREDVGGVLHGILPRTLEMVDITMETIPAPAKNSAREEPSSIACSAMQRIAMMRYKNSNAIWPLI